jgi:hypothetical protein
MMEEQATKILLEKTMESLLDTAAKHDIVPRKEIILSHALPLVSQNEKLERVDGHASAFFLGVADSVFLVTAAHVVDDAKDVYIAYYVPEEVPFESDGIAAITPSPNGNRKEDRIDIAVLKLKLEAVQAIRKGGIYKYFAIGDLDCDSPKVVGTLFTVAGFPHSKYTYDRAKAIFKPEPLSYLGVSVSRKRHLSAGVDPIASIAFKYNRKRAANEAGPIRRLTHPQSMSGGPVFHRDKLCGVFIEYDKTRALGIATRIEVVVEMIRDKWPELANLLPPQRIRFVQNP